MQLDSILADVRYGFRALVRKPIVSLVAIISIAVGTGGSTAIFTTIDSILLRPLPFDNPDQLASIWTYNTQQDKSTRLASYPDFADWREASRTYEEMGAWYIQPLALTGMGEPLHVNAALATDSLFSVLGTQPLIGRLFDADQAKDRNTVILSHRAWQQWFGADHQVIERSISLNGSPYTVIGVMPSTFQFPIQANPVDLWIKVTVEQGGMLTRRGARFFSVVGRMKPGTTIEQARAEMAAISGALQEKYPKTNTNIGVRMNSLSEELVGNVRPSLLILFGAVGLVLLIACVTVANLLVAEGLARGREIALRTALGAARGRIVRQLLTEYMLIAVAGGIAGGLIGLWACQTFVALSPVDLPRIHEIQLDGRVMAFTLGITVLTGIIFGLTPAIHLSASEPADALKDRTAGAGRGAKGRLTQKVLIVSQIAITQILLVGAGLLIHSFWRLQQASTGVDPRNVLSFKIGLPASYGEKGCVDFFQRLQQRLQTLPGVETASSVIFLPFSGQDNLSVDFDIEGRVVSESARPSANMQLVQPEYFRAMGIRLIDGRDFDERDNDAAPNVAIINEALARTYFDRENPIGKQVKQGQKTRTVIGIVGDVRSRGPQQEARPEIYMPLAQFPMDVMYVLLKTKVEPNSLVQAARGAVKEVDSNLPISDVQTLDQRFASTYARQRFSMSLLAVFAAVALFLTIVGLYGVLTNSVTQQRKEIGIRMALGASPTSILWRVVGHGMTMAVIGLIIGTVCATILTRFMESLLFGVRATDPLTFALLAAVLASVALMACYVPARRASRTDPLVVLGSE